MCQQRLTRRSYRSESNQARKVARLSAQALNYLRKEILPKIIRIDCLGDSLSRAEASYHESGSDAGGGSSNIKQSAPLMVAPIPPVVFLLRLLEAERIILPGGTRYVSKGLLPSCQKGRCSRTLSLQCFSFVMIEDREAQLEGEGGGVITPSFRHTGFATLPYCLC